MAPTPNARRRGGGAERRAGGEIAVAPTPNARKLCCARAFVCAPLTVRRLQGVPWKAKRIALHAIAKCR